MILAALIALSGGADAAPPKVDPTALLEPQKTETGDSSATKPRPAPKRTTMRFSAFSSAGESNARDRARLATETAKGVLREQVQPVFILSPGHPIPLTPAEVDLAATFAAPFSVQMSKFNIESLTGSQPTPAPRTDAYTTSFGALWEFAPGGLDSRSWNYGLEAHSTHLTVKSQLTGADFSPGLIGSQPTGPIQSACAFRPGGSFVVECFRNVAATFNAIAAPSNMPVSYEPERRSSIANDSFAFEFDQVRRETSRYGFSGIIGAPAVGAPFTTAFEISPRLRLGYERWDVTEVEYFYDPMIAAQPLRWVRSGSGHSGRFGVGADVAGSVPGGLPLRWKLSAEYGADFVDLDMKTNEAPEGSPAQALLQGTAVSAKRKLAKTMSYGSLGGRLDLEINDNWKIFAGATYKLDSFVTSTWIARTPYVIGPDVQYKLKHMGSVDVTLGVSFAH